MARVNLTRRAEIGSAKRARTRAAILDAARECYAAGPMTVDAVMQAAGLAKGTFYVHFEDLAALEAELGAELIAELDERLQPARLAASDPLTRLATATTLLLRYLAAEPARALLAARGAADLPGVSQAVHVRMRKTSRPRWRPVASRCPRLTSRRGLSRRFAFRRRKISASAELTREWFRTS